MRRCALVLLLALLGGCSALEFAYNNADTWLRWQGAPLYENDRFLVVRGSD